MGSSNPQSEISTPISLTTSYTGGETPEFNTTSNDLTTLIFDVTTSTGVTAITFKIQIDSVDFYKSGDSGFEVEEVTIALAASTANQKFAVRLDTRGMGDIRVVAKTVGGTGTLNGIQIVRDGSATITPAS